MREYTRRNKTHINKQRRDRIVERRSASKALDEIKKVIKNYEG